MLASRPWDTPAGSTIRIAVRTGRAGAVHDPVGHGEALVRIERHRLVPLDVDWQLAREHEEELVFVVVLVPVKVAVEDAQAHDRVVDRVSVWLNHGA